MVGVRDTIRCIQLLENILWVELGVSHISVFETMMSKQTFKGNVPFLQVIWVGNKFSAFGTPSMSSIRRNRLAEVYWSAHLSLDWY